MGPATTASAAAFSTTRARTAPLQNIFEIPNKQYPEPSKLHMARDATTSQLLGMTGGARTPKRWMWQRKAL